MSEHGRLRRGHAPLPPEATGARPGPWSVLLKVLSAVLSGGLMVLLFMAIIPKLTEFGGVGEQLEQMNPLVVVSIVLVAILIRVASAESIRVLTPTVNVAQSIISREASTAVSNVVPGPSGTAAQWAILRSWGVTTERFARATLASSTTQYVLVLIVPGALVVVWALAGAPAAQGGSDELLVALIAVAVSVVVLALVSAVTKSVPLAHRLGRLAELCVNPLRKVVSKPPLTGVPERFVTLRADLIEEARERGWSVLGWVFANYALNGILLVGCLWACGASYAELPLTLGLILYGVGRVLTMIQITPGGIGVVEIVYTSLYVWVLGDSSYESVVAGVLVYRALTYVLPIVTGAFAYVLWRLMRHKEIRDEKAATEAAEAEAGAAETSSEPS